jgi:Zn finger protein HypA/HybF involved in hydrogenase expression
MADIKEVTAKCRNCGREFPFKGLINFGSTEVFESVTLSGNRTNCPHCGQWTVVDKKDLKVTVADGTVYKDYG